MAVLSDGGWHRMAVSVSSGRLALYVDCSMVESVDWAYKDGLGISTDGLVMVGGIIEGFETPFEVSMQTYKDVCSTYHLLCDENNVSFISPALSTLHIH